MTTDPNDHRPPHAPDVGFISRGSVFALCSCGALQIVDPAFSMAPRPWLRKLGWSRPLTILSDPDDGWVCPTCTTPHDARPTANRITVTPETLRRAEALGFEPGEDDVLLWALREVDRLQFAVAEFKQWSQAGPNGCPPYSSSLAGYLRQLDASFAALRDIEERIRESRNTAWAERDAARRDLARIVQLCRDAVDHLEIAAIQPDGAIADRLRVEAGERPAGVICGVVVSERVSGNVITRTLCPLPPGHDGDHAEALAGGD